MNRYDLEFKEENVYTMKSLPADEGEKIIYVFRDTSYNNDGKWIINEILYIGKSIDSDGRLNVSHNKIEPANQKIETGHFLTFTYHKFNGNTSDETIRAIENALIYINKPCLNKNGVDNYNFDSYGDIEVHCSGVRSTKLIKDIYLKEKR